MCLSKIKLNLFLSALLPGVAAYLVFFGLRGEKNIGLYYGLFKFLQFSWPLFFLACIRKETFRFKQFTFRDLRDGLILGCAFSALLFLLFYFYLQSQLLANQTPFLINQKLQELGFRGKAEFVLLALALSVFHSFLEETYWRYFLFREIRLLLSSSTTKILMSLAFSLHHFIVLIFYLPSQMTLVVLGTILVFSASFLWAVFFEKRQSIGVPWISHMVADFAIMYLVYDLLFTSSKVS